MTEFFITDNSSSSRTETEEAMSKAKEIWRKYSHSHIILQFPSKIQIRYLFKIFNPTQIRSLEKINSVVAKGINFKVHTSRKPIPINTKDIIFSYLPSKKNLDEIAELKNANGIIIIPWDEEDRKLAIDMFNPIILSGIDYKSP